MLLVEDDPVCQDIMLLMLDRLGYQADVAGDGTEALLAMQAECYDLVLMDVRMPRMNGIEAAQLIRTSLDLPDQPTIIAMTADSTIRCQEECLQAGMNGHIGKPVRIGDLDAALKDLLHRPGKVAALDSSSLNPLPSSGESTTAVVYNDVVLEELLADLGGDEAMGTDLIQSFLLDNRQRFTAILSAGDAGDLDALAFQAHAIKSASAMIGLLALSEVAGEIEAAANEAPDEVDVGLQASRLAAECHRASEVLNALLLTPPG